MVAVSSFPTSEGIHPVKLLLVPTNSSKVVFISPMLEGIQPVILLLAKTITDAGLFPRFSGIVCVNLLSFKNIASSFLLKSSAGSSPSKLLNRISINLISGMQIRGSGNSPTKRLLLISASCKSVNLQKLFGIIPQNLFVLM
ncbi:hypothetical protein KIW84_051548 [Lathyrus oleraceus]|uniref:Uncharacterized protein n=1 Tax=Pisum sativum TaxID=3888 RepID=A0A9D5AE14_PEA|nr:hypothetical protein KIW84_051548 [Pisum sativum]